MCHLPCRLCLDYERQKIDVFDETNPDSSMANSITKLFSFTVNSSDNLRKICIKCMRLVNEFNEFHTLVADTQAYLATTILTHNALDTLTSQTDTSIESSEMSADDIKFYKYEIKSEMLLRNDPDNAIIKHEIFEKKEDSYVIEATRKNKNVNGHFTSRSKCETIHNDPYIDNSLHSFRWNSKLDGNSSSTVSDCVMQEMKCDIAENKNSLVRPKTISVENTVVKKSVTDCIEPLDDDDDSVEDDDCHDEDNEFPVDNNIEFPSEVMKDGEFILRGYRLHDLVAKYFKLQCELCPGEQTFTNFYKMCRHYKMAHDTKGYVACCGKKYKAWDETKCHMVYHLQPSALQCPTCKVNFPTGTALKRHARAHLPESEKTHKCDECGRGWADDKALRQHKRSHLPYDERYPHKCPICNKSFTKYGLKNHNAQVHEKKVGDFLCPTCGRNFHNRIAMEHHLSCHDVTGEMSVICKVCDMILKNRFTLKQHMKQHGDKLKHCTLCSFSTYRTGPLTVHMRVKHSDIKPYECNQCDKKFKLKSCLDTHMVQHTGEKKYSCAYCPKTFATSGNHSLHRKRIHLEEYMNDTKIKKKHIYKVVETNSTG